MMVNMEQQVQVHFQGLIKELLFCQPGECSLIVILHTQNAEFIKPFCAKKLKKGRGGGGGHIYL